MEREKLIRLKVRTSVQERPDGQTVEVHEDVEVMSRQLEDFPEWPRGNTLDQDPRNQDAGGKSVCWSKGAAGDSEVFIGSRMINEQTPVFLFGCGVEAKIQAEGREGQRCGVRVTFSDPLKEDLVFGWCAADPIPARS